MSTKHTVKSFELELQRLEKLVLTMGETTLSQMEHAFRALEGNDLKSAHTVLEQKTAIKEMESQVDHLAVRMLALRQPMAVDLRQIVTSIRIAVDLERISDYSVSIVRKLQDISEVPLQELLRSILEMEGMVKGMLGEVLEAYSRRLRDKAHDVWHRDGQVDESYGGVLQDLREVMRKDPDCVQACTNLLFIAKSIERMGDHITNIAEQVHYMIDGTLLHEGLPGDRTACRKQNL